MSQFTIFTTILTCFIHYALIKMMLLSIHYLFNSRRWRLPFGLHLYLAITWSLLSAHMAEYPVFLNENPFF